MHAKQRLRTAREHLQPLRRLLERQSQTILLQLCGWWKSGGTLRINALDVVRKREISIVIRAYYR